MHKRKSNDVDSQIPPSVLPDLCMIDQAAMDILSKEPSQTNFSLQDWDRADGIGPGASSVAKASKDKPYVGLMGKLSRAFVTHMVFSLAVVLYTLIMLSQTVKDKGEEVKQKLQRGCNGLEVATTALASIPHYAAEGMNQLTVGSINGIVSQSANMLSGAVNLLNQLILMLLQRYTGLLLCLLDALIQLAVGTVSFYAEEVTDFINTQMATIADALDKSLGLLNDQLSNFQERLGDAIQEIAGLFGGTVDSVVFKPVNFPTVKAKLGNIQIPTDFVDQLKNLPSEVPSLMDLQEKLAALVSTPFEKLESLIDEQLGDIKVLSNDVVPVPAAHSRILFCDNAMDYGWVDTVVDALRTALLIGVGIVVAVAALSIICNMVIISYDHWQFERSAKNYAKILQEQNNLRESGDETLGKGIMTKATARELLCAAASPTRYRYTMKLTDVLCRSDKGRMRFRWFLDYICHKPSLICFATGLTGLFVILLQLWMIDIVKDKTAEVVESSISASVDKMVRTVQVAMSDVIDPYVNNVNARIYTIESTANHVLFGWVNNTMDAIDNTLRVFAAGLNNVMDAAFGEVPPLKTAAIAFANCVLGTNTRTLESLSATLRAKASLSLPRIDADLLSGMDGSAIRTQLLTARQIMTSTNTGDVETTAGTSHKKGTMYRLVRRSSGDNNSTSNDDEDAYFKEEAEAFLESYRASLHKQILPFAVVLAFGSVVFWMGTCKILVCIIMDNVKNWRGNRDLGSFENAASPPSDSSANTTSYRRAWLKPFVKSTGRTLKSRRSEETVGGRREPAGEFGQSGAVPRRHPYQSSPIINNVMRSSLFFGDTPQSLTDSPLVPRTRTELSATPSAPTLMRTTTAPAGPRKMHTDHILGPRPGASPSGPRGMLGGISSHPIRPSISANALSSFTKPSRLTNRPVSGIFSDGTSSGPSSATAPSIKPSTLKPAMNVFSHWDDDEPEPPLRAATHEHSWKIQTNHPHMSDYQSPGGEVQDPFDDWNEISKEAAQTVALLAAKAKHGW